MVRNPAFYNVFNTLCKSAKELSKVIIIRNSVALNLFISLLSI